MNETNPNTSLAGTATGDPPGSGHKQMEQGANYSHIQSAIGGATPNAGISALNNDGGGDSNAKTGDLATNGPGMLGGGSDETGAGQQA